eukprot:EG_transcript_28524
MGAAQTARGGRPAEQLQLRGGRQVEVGVERPCAAVREQQMDRHQQRGAPGGHSPGEDALRTAALAPQHGDWRRSGGWEAPHRPAHRQRQRLREASLRPPGGIGAENSYRYPS